MATQESISRKEFLRSIGFGGAALMAVLTSCQNAGTGMVLPSGGISVDLTSKLLNVGNYVYGNGVIIARIATGNSPSSFAAVSQVCTHEGTTVVYTSGKFYCPNHGAQFNNTGKVTVGPANKSLTQYTATVNGTTLTIS